ncbi:DUF11 domain-containing protein [bacterium]|nr:DUF11 domain-containing protein [bacterium]
MRRLSWAIMFSLLCILMFQIGAQAAPKSVEVSPGAANPAPVDWPTAPADPNACTINCGEWIPYTVQSDTLNDPRVQDPSNGGTSPQNYVNVSSGCTDKSLPSVYYAFDDVNNVLFFRWRVEQIANTYATGPKAGSASSSDPWNSALWTVLIDTDGDGFREFAVHIDGSSGSPSNPIDSLAAIYSNTPSQSIDYINDPSIFLLNQKPTAFVSGGQIANYQSSNTPVTSWPNGSSETVWDYGATRSTEILNSCKEFFIDYQIPLAFLDATAVGGPQVTTTTPMALFFSTANSLNNPTQKDAVLNGDVVFVGDPNQRLPFGDTITPSGEVISQPVVESVTAASCGNTTLTALVKDALNLNGTTSVSAVEFYQFYDVNADGQDNDSSIWTSIGAATNSGGQNWSYTWNSTTLAKGQYLIGVKATDAQGNITWSYLDENEAAALGTPNYANPVPSPGVVVGTFLNTCGVSPRIVKTANAAEVVAGETVTFTLTVENPTADPLSLNAITDTLPAGFTFVATTGGTLSPVTSPSNGNSGEIVWTFAPQIIASNGTGTLIFTVTAPSVVGTYTNNAAMSTAQGSYDSNPQEVGVGAARLTLAKTANILSAAPGDPITYTITYANDSPVNVTNVVISDVIPLGLVNVTPLDGGLLNSGTITWNVGDLAPGTGPFNVRFTATVADPYPGGAAVPLVNTANIDSDQTDQVSASATTGINVPRPSLVIQKSADKSLVIPGGQVVFTLAYENVGNVPATDVVITDTLPAGFNFVAASNSGVHNSGIVTWTIGTVAALTSGFVTLTAAADSPFVDDNPAVNTATIDSAETSPLNDTFSVGVTQSGGSCTLYYFHDETIPSTILQDVAKTASPTGSLVIPTNVAPAANTEYARFYLNPALTQNLNLSSNNSVTTTLYLYKESGMTAKVRVLLYKNDSILANLIGQGELNLGTSALGSTTVPVANEVTVTITGTHSLVSGDRLLWVVQGEKAGSAGVKELGIGYNSAAAASNSSVCASPAPALTVDKVVSKQAAAPAETLTYTVTFANQGGTATGAVITDTLPTGVSFVSATLNGASITPSGSAPEYIFTVNTDDTATSGQVTGGESGLLVITATVDQPLSDAVTTLMNSVDFSADGASSVNDTATTTVVRPALTLTKSVDKSLLIPGDEATYTFVVLNSGDGSAANVTISDTLPSTAYFAYVSGSTTVDSSSVADPVSGNLFTLNLGSLAAGAAKTVTFKMQVTDNGSAPDGITILSNQAEVTSDQSDASPSQIVDVSISTNANLQISKSSAVDPALSAGDSITYTLLVTNTGTSTAQNVRVSDPIVSNGSYVAGTLQVESIAQTDAADSDAGQFDVINNRILVTVGDLAPGAARTIQFRVQLDTVLAQGTTPITNTATVNAGNAAARNAQRVDNADAAPQLTIDKSGPSSVPFPAARLTADATAATSLAVDSSTLLGVGQYVRINGQIARIVSINDTTVVVDTAITAANGTDVAVSFSYAIAFANQGTATATGVVVTDTLPSGTVFVTATNGGSHAAGIITWAVGTLQPGDTGSAQVVVIPTQAGDAVNQVEIGANGVSPVSDTVTTGVGGLIVRKYTTTPVVGQTLNGAQAIYVIEVENTTNSAANGVIVTDTLASGFTFVSTDNISGGSLTSPTPSVGSAQPAWGTFSIAANSTLIITFIAAIGDEVGAAVYQNDVAVTSTDKPVTPFDPLRTPEEDVQVIVPNVVLSKSVDPANVSGGEVVTYTVVTVNDGDGVATGVRISDTLPAGFSYAGVTVVSADVSGQVTRTATLDPSNGAVVPSWGAWSIAPAASLTVTFQVTATTVSGVFSNTVSATSDNSLIRTITDTAPVTVTSLTEADLSLTKSATPDPVIAGEVVTYTLVVTNNGPAAATGVTITDTLPVSVSFGSATAGCTENSGVVVCAVGSLAVNGSATFTIAVSTDSNATGSISNSAVAAANEDDPNPNNNSDSADVTVNPPPSTEGILNGRVWEDNDGDGIQDNGESGMAGVEVKLYDQNGDLVESTTTDADGIYTFTVPIGDYRVVVTPPNGHELSDADLGGNDNNDSDVNPTNGESPLLTIGAGSNQPIDAGIFMAAAIGDTVWFDYNGNGIIDQDEPGIGGVVVELQSPARARAAYTATTTAGGGYFLGPLRPGIYTVAVDLSTLPAGLKATFDLDGNGDSTAVAQLLSGQDNLNFDFGFNGDPRFEAAKTAIRLIDADSNNATSPGDTLRYTVVIANRGYAHATGVRFDDTPGRYTTLVGGSVTTTQGMVERGNGATDRQIAVNIGTIAVGAEVTISFDVRIAATVPADVVQVANQGVVSSNEVPSMPTDDPATKTPGDPTLTPIKSDPALVLTKQVTLDVDADANNLPSAGDTLRYTVTVKNVGGGMAQALVLNDTPDANTTLVVGSVTTSQGSVTGGNTAGDSAVAVNIGNLVSGGVMEIVYQVTINNPLPTDVKVLENQATVSGSNVPPTVSDDPLTPTGQDPTGTYVGDVVALGAFKEAQLYTDADNNSQPSAGDTLIYHVTVLNMGVVVAPSVSFTDTPDANTTLVAGSVKTTQGVVVTGNGGSDSSLSVNIGDMAAQSAVIVTFQVRVNAPLPDTVTEVANQGVVTSTSNNCDTPSGSCILATDDPTTRDADDPTVTKLLQSPAMEISKRYVGPAVIKLGNTLTYTIRITNTGDTILTQLPLTDTYSAAYLDFVDATPPADVIDEPSGTARWHDLTTVFGDLLPGDSISITTWMRASAITPDGVPATNQATVANVEDEFGQVLPTGEVRDTLFFGVAPNVLVSKQIIAPATVEAGQEITYSIRITNAGSSLIVTLPLSDVYESQVLNFVRAQPTQSRLQPGVAEWLDLTEQFGDLVPGASVEVLAVFTASHAVSNTVNLARVINAVDVQGVAADAEASEAVEVASPTAVTLLSFTATPEGNGLRVAWVTGAEVNSWGFHLWRSQSERRAEAVRITEQLIPAIGSAAQGASYHFLDSGVTPGTNVHYWLEETETDNSRHEYGPVRATWTTDSNEIEATPRIYLPWITAP